MYADDIYAARFNRRVELRGRFDNTVRVCVCVYGVDGLRIGEKRTYAVIIG